MLVKGPAVFCQNRHTAVRSLFDVAQIRSIKMARIKTGGYTHILSKRRSVTPKNVAGAILIILGAPLQANWQKKF